MIATKTKKSIITAQMPVTPEDYDSSNESTFRQTISQNARTTLQRLIDLEAVIGPQQATISAPSGGTTVDTQARTAINALIAALQAHGLIS